MILSFELAKRNRFIENQVELSCVEFYENISLLIKVAPAPLLQFTIVVNLFNASLGVGRRKATLHNERVGGGEPTIASHELFIYDSLETAVLLIALLDPWETFLLCGSDFIGDYRRMTSLPDNESSRQNQSSA